MRLIMWRGVQKEAHSVTFDFTCILVKQVATGMTGSKESCKFYKGVFFSQPEPSF